MISSAVKLNQILLREFDTGFETKDSEVIKATSESFAFVQVQFSASQQYSIVPHEASQELFFPASQGSHENLPLASRDVMLYLSHEPYCVGIQVTTVRVS